MNEQLSRQLWVIKFCLKVIYPKYNLSMFLVYLAIKYRILWQRKLSGAKVMETYKLKTIPQSVAKSLLQSTLDDYLPVLVDKCVIIPKEQFKQLCCENLYYLDNGVLWVAMKLSRESKKKYKDKIDKLSSSKNLNTLTSEIYKLLWTDTNSDSLESIRIIPLVGSNSIPDGEAITTENEFYNISSTFGLKGQDFEITFHPIPSLEYEPKMAASAEVSLILNEYDLTMEFLKEIVSNYFESARAVSVNDVFSIELSPEITGRHLYEHQDVISLAGKVYFKCTSMAVKKNTDIEKDNVEESELSPSRDSKTKENENVLKTLFIAKGETQMSMSDSLHMLKPKDEFFTTHRDSSHLLHQCPTGLREKFDQIQESIGPFLNGEINEMTSSLSSPIIPLLLLTGSIGSGRHRLVRTLAKYNGMSCLPIDCGTIMSSTAKQTESKIESTIQKAKSAAPCIVMMNNFEVFAVDPENNEDSRIIEYFMNSVTDLYQNYTKHQIIFIAITERQDLKPNILRMFLEKFHLARLNTQQRYETLEWFTKAMQLNIDGVALSNETGDLCSSTKEVLRKIAAKTETFTYGDIDALMHFTMRESYLKQQNNYDKLLKDPDITLVKEEDFNLALESIRSLQSQHLDAPKIPKVYWKDIGGLDSLKKELMKTIEFPIKYPHLFKNSSLRRSGLLLYGPPGCGKTLVAKAVSTELNVSFLSVKGPELLNMYIGQSEENVRKVFESARAASPCIVFLDELDALAPRRGAAGDSGGASDRLVSQLLAELDGVATEDDADTSSFVFVMGATNRPDLLEPSLLRPGRLDKLVYVGPYCGAQEKGSVLTALCRNLRLRDEVDLEAVAAALPERCTGADLMQVVAAARASAVRALLDKLHQGLVKESELSTDLVILGVSELCQGVESFRPSVTDEELAYYESLKTQL